MNSSGATVPLTLSRRSLLARAGVAAAGSALALSVGQRAQAARRWCSMDPIVVIDGRLADIFLASDLKLLLTATGPSVIRIALPTGSKGSVILNDLGFGLKGYDIKFMSDSSLVKTSKHTPVAIAAYVPSSDGSLPLQVTFAPRSLDADCFKYCSA